MAETIIITVHPSPDGDGHLTVDDAMKQVLDLVELVGKADSDEAADSIKVVWRLAKASADSPFNVWAESSSSDPSVSVDFRASRQKEQFKKGMNGLISNGSRPTWMNVGALKIAKRVFERNLNGIAQTNVSTADADDPLQITPSRARRAAIHIAQFELDDRLSEPDFSRTEFGSAEGRIVAAATYYSKPALVIKERLAGNRVTAVLSDELAEEIGYHHSLKDIWQGRRVLLGGSLYYDKDSNLTKVDAETLQLVGGELMELNEIRLALAGRAPTPEEFMALTGAEDIG